MFWSSKEIREGGRQLLDKLQKYRPLIAAFNGKGKIIKALKQLDFSHYCQKGFHGVYIKLSDNVTVMTCFLF